MAHIKQGSIGRKSVQSWDNESLQLPPLPPTNLGNCRFFEIQYLFNVGLIFSVYNKRITFSVLFVGYNGSWNSSHGVVILGRV